MSADSQQQIQVQMKRECDPAVKQQIIYNARVARWKAAGTEESRRELLGVHYKGPLQEQAQIKGQLQPMAERMAAQDERSRAMEAHAAGLEAMLEKVLTNQQIQLSLAAETAEKVDHVETLANASISGIEGVSTQMGKFQKATLKGLGALAERGGTFSENCMGAASNAKAFTQCLLSLVMFFLTVFLFAARSYWGGTRAMVGSSRAIGNSIPVVGGPVGGIFVVIMSLAMLWVTTQVITIVSMGSADGLEVAISMLKVTRFIIIEVAKKIVATGDVSYSRIQADLGHIFNESGLSGDAQSVKLWAKDATGQSTERVSAWLKDQTAAATAAATTAATTAMIPTAQGIAESVAYGATASYGYGEAIVKYGYSFMPGMPTITYGGPTTGGKKRSSRGGTTEMSTRQQRQIDEINTLLKITGDIMLILFETCFKTIWLYNNVSDDGREKIDALLRKNGYFSELGKSDNEFMQFLLKTNKDVLASVGKCKQDPISTYNKKSLLAYFSNVMASPMLQIPQKKRRSLKGGRKYKKTKKMNKKGIKRRKTIKRKSKRKKVSRRR